jgi:hypothetical protein
LVPLVAAFVVSQIATPMFYPRYLIGTVPAWLLLAARGWEALRWRPGRAAVAVSLVVGTVVSLAAQLTAEKQDWEGALAEVERHGQPGDGVVLASHFLRFPVGYYYQGDLPVYMVHDGVPVEAAAGQVLRLAAAHRRLWLLHAYAGHASALRGCALVMPGGPHRASRYQGVSVYRYDGLRRPGIGTWIVASGRLERGPRMP